MILLVVASLLVPGDCRSETIESSATSLADVIRPDAVAQLEEGWVWGMEFEPARLEDVVVEGWTRFPITINPGRGGGQ